MCLSPAVHGPHVETVGHMEIYESIRGDGYLIEHVGPAHPSDLDTLYGYGTATAALEKLRGRGLIGQGSGRCDASGVPPLCLYLDLQTHTMTVQELAAELERIYDFDDACLGMHVGLVGITAPRCAPSDADCGPIRTEFPLEECAPHDPGAPRIAISSTETRYASYEDGSCSHDGDCYLAGCGEHCHSWTTPGITGFCSGTSGCAFCGCIAGRCRWFTESSAANAS